MITYIWNAWHLASIHILTDFYRYFYFSICQNQNGYPVVPESCMTFSKLLWSICRVCLILCCAVGLQSFSWCKLISPMMLWTTWGKSSQCWAHHKLSWHLLLQCISRPHFIHSFNKYCLSTHWLGGMGMQKQITAWLPGARHGWYHSSKSMWILKLEGPKRLSGQLFHFIKVWLRIDLFS